MSIQHHSPEEQAAQARMLNEFLGKAQREWPHKRISGDDDGETAFAIAADPIHQVVRIQFTKPMDWIGLDVNSARKMAALLIEKADFLSAPKKPTIDQLEAILAKNEDLPIEILPNGEIRAKGQSGPVG